MEYQKLNINAMPLNKWQIFSWDNFVLVESIFHQEDKTCKGTLSIRTKNNYELVNQINLDYQYTSQFFDRIFTANKDKQTITEINLETLTTKQSNSTKLPVFFWEKATCYHNLENYTYEVLDAENRILNSYKIEYPLGFKCCDNGVLLWNNNQKENNWIECRDPITNKINWKINLDWKFVRIELFQNVIVIEYHSFEKFRTDKRYGGERDWYNPNRFTMAFSTFNGDQIWKHKFVFSQIDKENQVVFGGDNSIYEVDLKSGELLNQVRVNPEYYLGYCPHFKDSSGYYYTLHNGKFGKVNKHNGIIEWEFDLIDKLGAKRKITDWNLLSNGSLIIKAMPNHKNGDITCIFNPKENINYSKIER